MLKTVITPAADVRETPDAAVPRGKLETQLVYGETFVVHEEKSGWCKGICRHDGYAGWIESRHLGALPAPTHIVTAAHTHVYREASIKSPSIMSLSFGSLVTPETGWIFEKHLATADSTDKDYVTTALKFLETPYYWGGRSGFGIDCSGLVQVCLARAGIDVPRDTEEQVKAIGQDADGPQAGDIIFFSGHVGIMSDDKNIVHANAFHMKVTVEPLQDVATRSNGMTAIKRL